jgi:carbon-monoxide dehydrogenase small subunit|tara:strand:- start:218 stop:688 length:471 start_codon:yes stop_codon:yes gene_type:complete
MPDITLKVNGKSISQNISSNTLLSSFLRDTLNLTGTHVGCDTSQCGACSVHLDGKAVKSCSILAIQADGCEVTTIEGISDGDKLHPMQEAFRNNHGLQCGYCTPGMIMSGIKLVEENPNISESEIRKGLEGNICRCTGYNNIVKSIAEASVVMGGK